LNRALNEELLKYLAWNLIKKYLDNFIKFSYTSTCKEKSFTGGALLKEKSK